MTMAIDVRREVVVQPMEVAETGSEASVVPPPTEPNIVPTVAELPSSSSIASSADAAGGHNGIRVEIVSLCKT